MKFIGIDLHTNCFTCRFLDVHGGKAIVTYTITDQGIEDFIKQADLESTVIIEATCNSFAFDQLEQLEATIKTLKDMIKESASCYMKEIDILTSMRGISSLQQ